MLVGTSTVAAVAFAGRRIGGASVGLVAAAITAVYPNLWIYDRELHAEPLAFLLAALAIWQAYTFLERPTTLKATGPGSIVRAARIDESGAGAAVRVALPARGLRRARQTARQPDPVVDRRRGHRFALILSPWIVYNNMRFDEPVTLTTNFGEAMRIGNCPSTYSGRLLGSFDPDCPRGLRPW